MAALAQTKAHKVSGQRPFARLRAELRYRDIDEAYLEDYLHRSHSYVSSRMTGGAPWTADEIYRILDLLGWPTEQLHELFPDRRNFCKEKRGTRP